MATNRWIAFFIVASMFFWLAVLVFLTVPGKTHHSSMVKFDLDFNQRFLIEDADTVFIVKIESRQRFVLVNSETKDTIVGQQSNTGYSATVKTIQSGWWKPEDGNALVVTILSTEPTSVKVGFQPSPRNLFFGSLAALMIISLLGLLAIKAVQTPSI